MSLTDILLVLLLIAAALLGWRLWAVRAPNNKQDEEASRKNLQERLDSLYQFLSQQREATAERLGALEKNLSQDMAQHREKISTNLGDMHKRLEVIDRAQKNIAGLEAQTRNLQQILDNQQSRGAFGEVTLEALVRDMLSSKDYAFQHKLSNGKRVDCLIHMPHPPGPVPIDSKFPLAAWTALQTAKENQDEAAAAAAEKQLKADILGHAQDIAARYLIAGETAESALMFLPSESIFAALHIRLPDVMQACRRLRVYPVSPNTMWMALNTLRAIIRDVAMHKQARVIQQEVGKLLEDVARLHTRVGDLRRHFDRANQDIEAMEVSRKKIAARGDKIQAVEFDDAPALPPSDSDQP